MSVSVNTTTNNNNSNGLLYTASAAGGAGLLAGAAGYLSKPYLKDGEFTDEFIKNVALDVPDVYFKETLKKVFDDPAFFKSDIIKMLNEDLETLSPEMLKSLKDDPSLWDCPYVDLSPEDTLESLKNKAEKFYKEADWDELHKKEVSFIIDEIRKDINEGFWDSSKKQFKKLADDASEEMIKAGDCLKKAANKMSLKTAGIWAGVAAITAGAIGGLILACSKSKPEPAQKQVNLKS